MAGADQLSSPILKATSKQLVIQLCSLPALTRQPLRVQANLEGSPSALDKLKLGCSRLQLDVFRRLVEALEAGMAQKVVGGPGAEGHPLRHQAQVDPAGAGLVFPRHRDRARRVALGLAEALGAVVTGGRWMIYPTTLRLTATLPDQLLEQHGGDRLGWR